MKPKEKKMPNRKNVNVHDENLEMWDLLDYGTRSALVNWTLKYKIEEYLEWKRNSQASRIRDIREEYKARK